MYNSADEIFENVFTPKIRYLMLSNIRIGLKAFNEFIDENKNFLDYAQITNFLPQVRAYSINRQFALNAESLNCPFNFTFDEIPPYKYKVSFITMPGVIMTLAKTFKPNKLPNRSKYKTKLAGGNCFENMQQSFLGESEEFNLNSNNPNYCLITYGVHNDELTHAGICIPDKDFRSLEGRINLMDTIGIFEENEEQQETLPKLKNELKNLIQKKG